MKDGWGWPGCARAWWPLPWCQAFLPLQHLLTGSRVPMATDQPLLKNLPLVWKVQELEGIDPNFTEAGSVSDKVIDFVQTCPM